MRRLPDMLTTSFSSYSFSKQYTTKNQKAPKKCLMYKRLFAGVYSSGNIVFSIVACFCDLWVCASNVSLFLCFCALESTSRQSNISLKTSNKLYMTDWEPLARSLNCESDTRDKSDLSEGAVWPILSCHCSQHLQPMFLNFNSHPKYLYLVRNMLPTTKEERKNKWHFCVLENWLIPVGHSDNRFRIDATKHL